MRYKDYYATLGVERNASADDIKKAYRQLARKYHPDVSREADAEAKFKELGEAYETLKDPEKRAAYDELGRRPQGEEFSPPPNWRRQHAHDFGQDFGSAFDESDLADLFAAFGHAGRARRTGPMHGQDYEAIARITLEQAHHGGALHLQVDSEEGPKTLEVTVPAGVTEGQKLRLRGRGGKGRNGGADGDIYLHIQLLPHPVFRTDGHDLYFDLALAPWEAALGAEVEVKTLDGPVTLKVPAGTRSGRKLRLKARGLATGRGGRGDLYAVAHVDVPATLTPREKELFEALAQASTFNPRAVAGGEEQR